MPIFDGIDYPDSQSLLDQLDLAEQWDNANDKQTLMAKVQDYWLKQAMATDDWRR
jgi:hypothetical protein